MEFVAKVHKLGINLCVDVPERIVNALLLDAKKQSGPVHIKDTLNSAAFEANVVKYSGGWRRYLNTQMRKDAGVDVGNIVLWALRPMIAPSDSSFQPRCAIGLRVNRTCMHSDVSMNPS